MGAVLLSRFVRSLLYEGVSAHDPGTLAGVAAVFILAAVLASDIPARRTAAVEPAGVLREE